MDREQAYLRMLGATANMQWNMAVMLEAKAEEAEKARNWICNHITAASFNGDHLQLKQSIQMHDQIIEVLDGVNKMSQGIVSVLRAVLPRESEEDNSDYGDSD
ncbi:restriction endonuclease subunit S [Paenibacillus sp. NEAU-GSW1]|uniref:restriction endonuclease subunit S n=1 Tax=Paenibacillus sp. NEAU-GSW1 TaxID=2682486 RepID=UPI0012E192E8|nr:restriction endonuclease subunit S [Paenibacillus sp. NEAU-GSW1]MUT65863.1 restriction endonuclease subunit S [Paenibacillus sp. NEAU-GSW1]